MLILLESNFKQSFGRTFVMIPSAAGSKAAASGWPMVIINDQLTLIDHPLSGAKTQLLVKFAKATQLTIKYAETCLKDNKWNEVDAMKAFAILKSSRKLPSDAFE